MKGKKVWTVTATQRNGMVLERYMVIAANVGEASKKGLTLARSTWGRDCRIDKVEYEGTIDA